MLDNIIGMVPTPCSQKRMYSALAGGFVSYYPGLRTLLPFSPMVHYAAAGVGLDLFCRGGDVGSGTQELLMSAAAGVAGAYAASKVLGTGY